jgi:hypothetical protein
MLKSKAWTTCTYEKLGPKRQDYLDRLTQEMANVNFTVPSRESKIWKEAVGLARSDLIFESSDKISVMGVRAASLNGNLRVGFLRVGKAKPVLLLFFSGLGLALALSFISLQLFESIPRHTLGLIFLVIFGGILALPLSYLFLIRRTCYHKVRILVIETAKSLGGKQLTPFKKTTVELGD